MKIFSLLILVFSVFSIASADFTSTSFELENPINFLEGGQSSSSSFQYISTTGQLTQGQSESLNFAQNAGFLYFPDVVVSSSPSPGGGGGGVSMPGLNIFCSRIADLNCDSRVDLFDLSILLYYVKRPNLVNKFNDLNGDGKIDFIDISIMFYYWDDV